ncbi:hypothetical protein ASU31_11415 [Pedobacter ginsenosidimutans]|uniref:Uncharacterized protein n=1 Tax=Pedobacter ginsenosidimutans TaxID=687842 RepID=A0A0T5VQG2_9SPHI|nr:hypothetical protein ASU31_11415 [Pedobacter ginsenosidimutans]
MINERYAKCPKYSCLMALKGYLLFFERNYLLKKTSFNDFQFVLVKDKVDKISSKRKKPKFIK